MDVSCKLTDCHSFCMDKDCGDILSVFFEIVPCKLHFFIGPIIALVLIVLA